MRTNSNTFSPCQHFSLLSQPQHRSVHAAVSWWARLWQWAERKKTHLHAEGGFLLFIISLQLNTERFSETTGLIKTSQTPKLWKNYMHWRQAEKKCVDVLEAFKGAVNFRPDLKSWIGLDCWLWFPVDSTWDLWTKTISFNIRDYYYLPHFSNNTNECKTFAGKLHY